MALKLVTAPVSYPVTLEEAKAHLNVDFTDDDTLIGLYLKAASEDAENFTGRAFFDQTWDFYLDAFPNSNGPIQLPRSPLIEVLGMFNAEDTVDEAGYLVDTASEPARLSLPDAGSWPTISASANAIRVRFRAGYVDEETSPVTGSIPFAIKAAVLLTLGTLYAHRETVKVGETATMMPWSAQQLLRPYRIYTAMA